MRILSVGKVYYVLISNAHTDNDCRFHQVACGGFSDCLRQTSFLAWIKSSRAKRSVVINSRVGIAEHNRFSHTCTRNFIH